MRSTFLFSLALMTIGCRRQVEVGGSSSQSRAATITSADQLVAATHWYKP